VACIGDLHHMPTPEELDLVRTGATALSGTGSLLAFTLATVAYRRSVADKISEQAARVVITPRERNSRSIMIANLSDAPIYNIKPQSRQPFIWEDTHAREGIQILMPSESHTFHAIDVGSRIVFLDTASRRWARKDNGILRQLRRAVRR
jgi:hypothetical protein